MQRFTNGPTGMNRWSKPDCTGPALRLLGGSVLAVALTACVTSTEGKQMKADIGNLQTQMQEARAGIDAQQAQLAEQLQKANAQVKELSDTLADLNRAARNTDADFGVQLDQLRAELQEVRGQIELTDYRVGQMQAQMQAAPVAGVTPVATPQQPEDSAKPPAAAPKDKKGMVGYAQNLYTQKQYSEARGVYREVVKQWGNEAGYGDLAHMKIGDTFFDEKRFRDALPEYIKVVEKFSKGEYADDAYYKIGLVSMELGNLEDAQTFFGEVVKSYKKSPLVPQAQAKLSEVQKRLDKEKANKGKKKG